MNHNMDRQQQARHAIADFEARPVTSQFIHIQQRDVVRELRQRVAEPYRIHQAAASLCGPASLLYILVKTQPDLYVKYVIHLFEHGTASVGRIRVKPRSVCKRYDCDDRNVPEVKRIAVCDWLALASLRDSENSVFPYDSVQRRWAGITWPWELTRWGDAVGFQTVDAQYSLWQPQGHLAILKMAALKSLGYEVAVFVNSGIMDQPQKKPLVPNHWVVLSSSVLIDGKSVTNLSDWTTELGNKKQALELARKKINFSVFTWGNEYPINRALSTMTVNDFSRHFYGFVAVK